MSDLMPLQKFILNFIQMLIEALKCEVDMIVACPIIYRIYKIWGITLSLQAHWSMIKSRGAAAQLTLRNAFLRFC